MNHHVLESNIKEIILSENPVLNISTGNLVLIHKYVKEFLIENKKTLILDHEDALKSLNDKIGNVFGPLLKLWTVMEEESRSLWGILPN